MYSTCRKDVINSGHEDFLFYSNFQGFLASLNGRTHKYSQLLKVLDLKTMCELRYQPLNFSAPSYALHRKNYTLKLTQ